MSFTPGKPVYPVQLFQDGLHKERLELLTELLLAEYVPAEKPKKDRLAADG